jgi:hypothetical protein
MRRVGEGYGRFTDGTAGYIRVSADRVTDMELLQLCFGLKNPGTPKHLEGRVEM